MRMLIFNVCAAVFASAAHGQTVEPPKTWTTCAACHAAPGPTAIGPTLNGVVGRRAGSVPGFGYSRAMKSAGITWDEESLTAFLGDPQRIVPGNRMAFPGVQDSGDLVELVRYLLTLR